MKRNPKLKDSNLYDCRPQTGPCPIGCNQCFYNHHYYEDINEPRFPSVPSGGIVRVNCGHDSNINRTFVIDQTERYSDRFFNTSIASFNFPGPVVWTANPKEEEPVKIPNLPANVMFVRLRVSQTNLKYVYRATARLAEENVPIMLTFMAYYDMPPFDWVENYEFRKRHINPYYCPKDEFMHHVWSCCYIMAGTLVSICGKWCRNCRNCETYYLQTKKRLLNLEGIMV